MIVRGTTPTIQFTFKTIDVSQIHTAYLTIEQHGTLRIEKTLEDATIGNKYIEWTLEQEDTLPLKYNVKLQIQCRYKLNDGTAYASRIYEVSPYDILKEGEI